MRDCPSFYDDFEVVGIGLLVDCPSIGCLWVYEEVSGRDPPDLENEPGLIRDKNLQLDSPSVGFYLFKLDL